MIFSRTRAFFVGGLILLVAGLFVAAYQLNSRQYRVSSASLEMSFRDGLDRQAEDFHEQIAEQEAIAFGCFKTDRVLEQELFIIEDARVAPACTEALLEKVPVQDAESAFAKGLASRSTEEARQFF